MVQRREVPVIHSATVINPNSGEVLTDHDIYIERGIITKIEPSKQGVAPKGLDATGLFAIPGLIDSHVHSLGFMDEDIPGIFDLRWMFRQQTRNLTAYLHSGVTTIRDMGSALYLIRNKSRNSAHLKIEAPRILYAGPLFTVPQGYPHYLPHLPFFLEWITGPVRIDLKEKSGASQVETQVDKVVAAGASCIKVGYQSEKYDETHTKIPIISLPLLDMLVRYAHKHGRPVAIHHTFRKDLQNLLSSDIPFDSLEHLTTDEELSNEEVENIVQRGIPVSTTLSTYGIIHHVDELEALIHQEPERFEPKPTRFFQQMFDAVRTDGTPMRNMTKNYLKTALGFMSRNLKKLMTTGGKIVFATDTGIMSPPGCPLWELKDMIRAGMTPLETLKSATNIAADVIGMPELGRLELNKVADIVFLHKNPLENIKAVGDVAAVIRDGFLVYDHSQKKCR
jgi:imidazolonepropionase-like amidohydrolase